MGKNNLILGTARGKLGDVVFYRTGGEQRFRTRVRPTNPRTNAQLIQRCVVSTAVKFYSQVATICNHAFQNVEGSLKNHQRFMKLNIDMLRKLALTNIESLSPIKWTEDNTGNYTWKNSMEIAINPYIVSEGDLREIEYGFEESSTGSDIPLVGTPVNSETQFKLFEATYQQIADLLGVQAGDQITMIALIGDLDSGYIKRAEFGRIIMMPSTGNMSDKFYGQSTQELTNPNKENYGTVSLATYTTKGENMQGFVIASNSRTFVMADVVGYAVIVSRFENDRWRRSNARISVRPGIKDLQTLKSAVASYMKSDESSLYLNQATTEQQTASQRESISIIEDDYKEIKVQTEKTKKNNKDAE